MDWLILVLLVGQQATPTGGDVAAGPVAFGQAIAVCAPASLKMPHPLMPSFETLHRIEGEDDGLCLYTQTMPGDMHMECRFTEAGRKAYAAEFERMAAGQLSGSNTDKPAWADECEIVMKDGKHLPAFGTTRTK